MNGLRRRLLLVTAVILLVLSLGTGWYVLVEGWSFLEALYMTVITLTTVGFGEVRPLSPAGKLFTILLILLGVGTVAYSLSSIGEYLLTRGVIERLRKRGIMNRISRLENHVIICGAGRVGQTAARTLQEMNNQFVLVDSDPDLIRSLEDEGWIALEGDSTHDEVLLGAGIERAAGLLVCTGNDSDNLFIVLSARSLAKDLFIVARSVDSSNERKMRRAGANKVISPYQIGGRHMANIVVRPHVAEFMDVVTLDSGLELWLEEIAISENSPLAGKTVVEADMRRQTGVTLVALLQGGEKGMITPDENTRFAVGDELIVLGTRQQLAALEDFVGSSLGHPPHARV
jgi:voltage-gated potassium channel